VTGEARDRFRIAVSRPLERLSVVALAGELDLACAPELSRALADLAGTGCDRVVVELSELSFIDSTGIKALIAAARAMEEEGGALTLSAPTPNVARVFEIVKLSDVIPIEEGRDNGAG
jgi:anti-anti-sigma factor